MNSIQKMKEKLHSKLKPKPTITPHPCHKNHIPVHMQPVSPPRRSQPRNTEEIQIQDCSKTPKKTKMKKNNRKYSPKINKRSKSKNRSVEDLLAWDREKNERSVRKRMNQDTEYSFSPQISEKSLKLSYRHRKRYKKAEDRLLAYGKAKIAKRRVAKDMMISNFFKPTINSKSKEIMKNKGKSQRDLKLKENGKTENLDFFKIEPDYENQDYFTLKRKIRRRKRDNERFADLSLSRMIKKTRGEAEKRAEKENETEEEGPYISPYSRKAALKNYTALRSKSHNRQQGGVDDIPLKPGKKSRIVSKKNKKNEIKGKIRNRNLGRSSSCKRKKLGRKGRDNPGQKNRSRMDIEMKKLKNLIYLDGASKGDRIL